MPLKVRSVNEQHGSQLAKSGDFTQNPGRECKGDFTPTIANVSTLPVSGRGEVLKTTQLATKARDLRFAHLGQ